MSANETEQLKSYLRRNYSSKLKEFRNGLIVKLQLLGYAVIIMAQMKFAGNIVLFIFRFFLQSILSTPYPTDHTLMRIINGYRAQGNDEPDVYFALRRLFKRIESILVYATLVLNFLVIVDGVIWPIDFEGYLEHFRMPNEPKLANSPSPFNHGKKIVEGEIRRQWFTQFIGEQIPGSNFTGGVSYLFFQFLILFLQVGLLLTSTSITSTHHLKKPNDVEDYCLQHRPNDMSDGYNGDVLILELDPVSVIENAFGVIETVGGTVSTINNEAMV